MPQHHSPQIQADPQPPVDVRIVAIQSAALRLENLIEGKVITEPVLLGQLTAMAQRLRREIGLLKLNQQTPVL